MPNLFGQTLEQLQELCLHEGFPKFTAMQLCDWMYKKRVTDFDSMTNLSLKIRARLGELGTVGRSLPVDCQTSVDGTKKYLFHTGTQASPSATVNVGDHDYIESVFIPTSDRATLCISCQKGCKMGCSFCVTGRQGFHGSLSASDILNQLFSIPESQRLTNVVFMGMGEPMDNYEAVRQSLEVLTSSWGLAWSPQRITVSTVGIIPSLRRLLDETRCHVAVSLHNAVPAERERLMPVERAYPISDVVALLRQYDWHGQRRISFEYIMFRGINDDIAHAAALLNLLRGLPCRVNLIRFHTSPDMPYRTSSDQAIDSFSSYLNSHGITCTLRASRGEDIMAACGLLAGKMKDSEKRI
ncbi:MAG: 23S rRNA (adenine(2503)-C(2))-methyltransferase RlmN [Bacteroidales bacterium]|nr:23S rRNA (adenine(2503)-C(2))-methyltransferase RlmN [Bacteroidales bacterium]